MGAKPRKHMTYMLITLARLSSSARVWRIVLMEAAVTTSPAPKTASNASDNQSVPDSENPVNAAPATTVVASTTVVAGAALTGFSLSGALWLSLALLAV